MVKVQRARVYRVREHQPRPGDQAGQRHHRPPANAGVRGANGERVPDRGRRIKPLRVSPKTPHGRGHRQGGGRRKPVRVIHLHGKPRGKAVRLITRLDVRRESEPGELRGIKTRKGHPRRACVQRGRREERRGNRHIRIRLIRIHRPVGAGQLVQPVRIIRNRITPAAGRNRLVRRPSRPGEILLIQQNLPLTRQAPTTNPQDRPKPPVPNAGSFHRHPIPCPPPAWRFVIWLEHVVLRVI